MFSTASLALPAWNIVQDKSEISFTAIQEGAPVSAEFKSFDAQVEFDKDMLEESKVAVTIDMNSVYAEYEDLVDTLKSKEWFDVQQFPSATFNSTHFKKLKDMHYECEGDLTIRDKTVPVKITFQFLKYTDQEASLEGETTIKRNDFGVGQGEWASTEDVADEVVIQFKLHAIKQKPENAKHKSTP